MLYTHVAAAIVSAVLAAWGTWQVQGWRYTGQIAQIQKAHVEQLQKAEMAARQREQSLSLFKQQAEEKYVQEKRRAAAAASRAGAELDGLRNELYAARPGTAAQDPTPTGRADGATERELLGQCATALVGVAAEADRLAANVVGLQGYVKGVCLAGP
jgi:hypothetical protein